MTVTVEQKNNEQQQIPGVVTDVEQKVEDAAPAAAKPEVTEVEAAFNHAVTQAAEKAPEAEAKAATDAPAIEEAAKDAETIASGGTVTPLEAIHVGQGVVKEVKEGYKTTEFWLSVVIIVLANVGALHLPGKYGAAITTGAAAGSYAISRGLAK